MKGHDPKTGKPYTASRMQSKARAPLKDRPPFDLEKAREAISARLNQSLVATPVPNGSGDSGEDDFSSMTQRYAAELSIEMVAILADIARDQNMPPQTRRGCANDVITRGIGAPILRAQTMEVKGTPEDFATQFFSAVKSRSSSAIDVTSQSDGGSDPS